MRKLTLTKSLLSLTLGIALAGFTSCGDDDDDDDAAPGTIVDVASGTDELSTLVTLVSDAGLADTLSGTTEYTVFAPTNAAFTEVQSILDTLTEEQVRDVLLYHVVAGTTRSSALEAQQTVDAAASGQLFITSGSEGVQVNGSNGATVSTADVEASNGVVHIINKVLIPDVYLNIVEIVQKRYFLSGLVDAVVNADLVTTLTGDGPFTLFAPTNDAFTAIQDTVDGLSGTQLTSVLTYHVIGATALSTDLSAGPSPATVQGETITIAIDGSTVTLGSPGATTDATVTTVDLQGTNGVVHVIDQVLIPNSL